MKRLPQNIKEPVMSVRTQNAAVLSTTLAIAAIAAGLFGLSHRDSGAAAFDTGARAPSAVISSKDSNGSDSLPDQRNVHVLPMVTVRPPRTVGPISSADQRPITRLAQITVRPLPQSVAPGVAVESSAPTAAAAPTGLSRPAAAPSVKLPLKLTPAARIERVQIEPANVGVDRVPLTVLSVRSSRTTSARGMVMPYYSFGGRLLSISDP